MLVAVGQKTKTAADLVEMLSELSEMQANIKHPLNACW